MIHAGLVRRHLRMMAPATSRRDEPMPVTGSLGVTFLKTLFPLPLRVFLGRGAENSPGIWNLGQNQQLVL